MRPEDRDFAYLLDMKLAADDALSFVTGLDSEAFFASALHQSAVIRKLEVLGEAAGRVSKPFCDAIPNSLGERSRAFAIV